MYANPTPISIRVSEEQLKSLPSLVVKEASRKLREFFVQTPKNERDGLMKELAQVDSKATKNLNNILETSVSKVIEDKFGEKIENIISEQPVLYQVQRKWSKLVEGAKKLFG